MSSFTHSSSEVQQNMNTVETMGWIWSTGPTLTATFFQHSRHNPSSYLLVYSSCFCRGLYHSAIAPKTGKLIIDAAPDTRMQLKAGFTTPPQFMLAR